MPQKMTDHIITQALRVNASDVHIHPLSNRYLLRLRVNGTLIPLLYLPLDVGAKLISFLKFQAALDISEKRRPQSGSFEKSTTTENIALRLSTMPNKDFHESMVIRIFRYKYPIPFLKSSVFPKSTKQILQQCKNQTGLFLFSGSTGSGKSSSMYSLVSSIENKEELQIITIEDPVEHYSPGFLQIEINEKANITYAPIIRSVLRHDPDILIIGEIRDAETAKIVIRAALTGHLVLSTVHAGNAYGVLLRLLEFGISSEELAQCLLGISFQQLVHLQCVFCGAKCHPLCTHLGRKRTAIYEILTKQDITSYFRTKKEHIKPRNPVQTIYQKGVTYGFFSAD
ncbi:competence type IV pilus ATPase ComGA [Listeria swaminathanii]|uniref:Type II/IV secretion system protein n=1 Tax=Listeria swaminathanii TaxID=2713501 RepID=A0A7X1DMZ2_9LIST|nr:competence type IV pilus ATPase ComGA [Listeria swaminathanii]MBC2329473.1 type II/IV secretion system protein [Listeria swaminathanii]